MEISVIIPTLNPGEYLFDCLKSLDNQNLDKNLFEVVIVLNGNREPYFKIISGFLSNIGLNARLYYSETNGVSNARNFALDKVKADYVAFIDDDDIVSTTYLKGMLTLADKESIVVSNSRTFRKDYFQADRDYINSAYESCKGGKKISILKGRKFFSNSCGKLIPVSVINKTRFDKKLILGEDSVFMVEISRNINYVSIASADVIYYTRIREGSATRSRISLKNHFFITIYEIGRYISFCKWSVRKNNILFIVSRMGASTKSLVKFILDEIV